MPLSLGSRVVASDDQVHTSVGGETVILGMTDGVYYGLDAVGARVWELLAQPCTVAAIVDQIETEFDAPRTRIEGDVLALLEELAARRLVRAMPDDLAG